MLSALEYAVAVLERQARPRTSLYQYSTAVGSALVYAFLLLIVLAIAGWRTRPARAAPPASWPTRARPRRSLSSIGVYVDHRDASTRSCTAAASRA